VVWVHCYIALGRIYKRVSVTVKSPNDRKQRLNIETFSKFATGVKDLNSSRQEGEAPYFTAEEIRRIINRDIFEIPDTGTDAGSATPNDDSTPEDPIMNAPLRQLPDFNAMLRAYQYQFEAITPIGAGDPLPEPEPNAEAVEDDEFDEAFPVYEGMLRAVEVEDGTEDDDDNLNLWIWMPVGLYYLRPRNRVARGQTRVVEHDELLEMREMMPASRQLEINLLVNRLVTGQITLQQYNQRMKYYAETTDTHQFVMMRGGHNVMTPVDYSRLNSIIQKHFDEIDSLSDRIGDGNYSAGQIRVYSGSIINGTRESAEQGNASAYGVELPAYPTDGTTLCNKGCKCHWDLRQLPGDGNVDAYWTLGIAEHCQTCKDRASLWSPLQIRGGQYTGPIPRG